MTDSGADKDDTSSCSLGEWKCQNGECINAEFVCDNTQDCVDGSDEEEDFCRKRDCKYLHALIVLRV